MIIAAAALPVLYATVLLATETFTHLQLLSKVRRSSALSHGRISNELHNIEGAIQHFWNDHPFHLANGLVRNVLANGTETYQLVKLAAVETNCNAFFSNFYEGKVLSSIHLHQYSITDSIAVHRRRKKQSFCLLLAYDGQYFCGWQRQPHNLKSPSVQEIIENAIESAFVENGRPDVRVSGRTDSGVHALGQIARVRILAHRAVNGSTFVVTTDDVFNALNMAAQKSNYNWRCLLVDAVSDKFHPTFDSRSRSYAYILDANAVEALIIAILSVENRSHAGVSNYHLLVRFQTHLNSLLKCLIGKELDYYSLSYGSVKTESTLCCLQHAKVIIGKAVQSQAIDQTILVFEFTGNRFLRRMVRILVGTCIYHALLGLVSTPSMNHTLHDDTTLLDICSARERSHIVTVAPPDGLIFLGANVTKR